MTGAGQHISSLYHKILVSVTMFYSAFKALWCVWQPWRGTGDLGQVDIHGWRTQGLEPREFKGLLPKFPAGDLGQPGGLPEPALSPWGVLCSSKGCHRREREALRDRKCVTVAGTRYPLTDVGTALHSLDFKREECKGHHGSFHIFPSKWC